MRGSKYIGESKGNQRQEWWDEHVMPEVEWNMLQRHIAYISEGIVEKTAQ